MANTGTLGLAGLAMQKLDELIAAIMRLNASVEKANALKETR